jgi:hypothetical protein
VFQKAFPDDERYCEKVGIVIPLDLDLLAENRYREHTYRQA